MHTARGAGVSRCPTPRTSSASTASGSAAVGGHSQALVQAARQRALDLLQGHGSEGHLVFALEVQVHAVDRREDDQQVRPHLAGQHAGRQVLVDDGLHADVVGLRGAASDANPASAANMAVVSRATRDGLVEIQGGKAWPGVGFAMGQERLIELMRAGAEPETESPHVYLVMAGEGSIDGGLQLAESLRDRVPGLNIRSNLGGGSFKAQFKRADRSGAPLAIVLGEDELANRVATIKHLREQKPQDQVSFDELESWLNDWLAR